MVSVFEVGVSVSSNELHQLSLLLLSQHLHSHYFLIMKVNVDLLKRHGLKSLCCSLNIIISTTTGMFHPCWVPLHRGLPGRCRCRRSCCVLHWVEAAKVVKPVSCVAGPGRDNSVLIFVQLPKNSAFYRWCVSRSFHCPVVSRTVTATDQSLFSNVIVFRLQEKDCEIIFMWEVTLSNMWFLFSEPKQPVSCYWTLV